jgi:cell division protein FtsW
MAHLQFPPIPPRIYIGDIWLLIMAAILLAFGLIMMTSASVEISSSQFGDVFFHLKRQLIFLLIGICITSAVVKCPIRYWYKGSVALLALSYLLLF